MYRFQTITFRRTKTAASKYSKTEHRTGLVQVMIFEAADRDNIGGSRYGGQRSICCTPDLAKVEGCKQGEVIRIPSARDPNWAAHKVHHCFGYRFTDYYVKTRANHPYSQLQQVFKHVAEAGGSPVFCC